MYNLTSTQTETQIETNTAQQPTMPLSLASAGETVLIHEIRGGKKMRQRLMDLGLNLSEPIRILKNDIPCPMIIAIKGDSRLALGNGMSQKIMVKLVANCSRAGE